MADPQQPQQPQQAREADLKSKAAVGYKMGGDHCGACSHFIESEENEADETGRCELVAGDIGEDMVCRLFARKSRSLAERA